jgi:hypothetical protein
VNEPNLLAIDALRIEGKSGFRSLYGWIGVNEDSAKRQYQDALLEFDAAIHRTKDIVLTRSCGAAARHS